MAQLYSKKIIELYKKPHNMGKITKADAKAEVGSPICGDTMVFYLKVDPSGKISEIKFETMGCAASFATGSALTDIAKGKTLATALKINQADVEKALGGLPNVKRHCADLAIDTLRTAIKNYLSKK